MSPLTQALLYMAMIECNMYTFSSCPRQSSATRHWIKQGITMFEAAAYIAQGDLPRAHAVLCTLDEDIIDAVEQEIHKHAARFASQFFLMHVRIS